MIYLMKVIILMLLRLCPIVSFLTNFAKLRPAGYKTNFD